MISRKDARSFPWIDWKSRPIHSPVACCFLSCRYSSLRCETPSIISYPCIVSVKTNSDRNSEDFIEWGSSFSGAKFAEEEKNIWNWKVCFRDYYWVSQLCYTWRNKRELRNWCNICCTCGEERRYFSGKVPYFRLRSAKEVIKKVRIKENEERNEERREKVMILMLQKGSNEERKRFK